MSQNRKPVSFLIIGAGDRGVTYSGYSKIFPDEMEIVGVADNNSLRLNSFKNKFSVDADKVFNSWEEALSKEKLADAVIISTPDNLHYQPAVMAIEKGYDVLLEKPISNKIQECISLAQLNSKYKKIIAVCHVLRYSSFWIKLKKLIDDGAIGDVITIEHLEGVGWWHQAHSYVRGNWNNSQNSSPIILAKSSHDMDILTWLTGKNCKRISSFGSLTLFKKENAPKGSTERCTEGCEVEFECPYSAIKVYLDMNLTGWPVNTITDSLSYEGRFNAIKTGPYGRCVYHYENNVVDHQVVTLEFEDHITASFTMSAFTKLGRNIRVMGTMGELTGDGENIQYLNFRDSSSEWFNTESKGQDINTGHGGGDFELIKSFVRAVKFQDDKYISSPLEVSLQSHIMAFAAEESRLSGKIITLNDLTPKLY